MIELPPMPVSAIAQTMSAEGQFLSKQITTPEGTRKYKIYIPSNYDAAKPYALIVMLHGCTQDADNIALGTGLNSSAEEHRLIVVYPEQPASANLMKCWNWYEPANQSRDGGEPALIAGIAREVISSFSIDRTRVYIGGISAGAAMALATAYAYPDLFAAVGVHSGIALGAAGTITEGMAAMQRGAPEGVQLANTAKRLMGANSRFMPAILFQGGRDHVVNTANARNIVDQLMGLHGDPVAMALSYSTKGTSEGGYHYSRAIYGRDRDVVEAWTVDELGHAWSGGSPTGTYTDPKGPDATREMVRFFLDHKMAATKK